LPACDPVAEGLKPSGQVLRVPTTINRQLDLVAGVHPANRRDELIDRIYTLTIQRDNSISGLQSHLLGRSTRLSSGYRHALAICTFHNVYTQTCAATAGVTTLGSRWSIRLIPLWR
jgi:hypothetical protein